MTPTVKPKILCAEEHGLRIEQIDKDALYILDTLHNAGYTAYLVGGGVRDLLAGKVPKDFDISTDARPEEIKRLFRRNCMLIGRRFRLAHLRFGGNIFEVSTFRSGNVDESRLILHDNEWGSPEEDVLRRDFTMNGLFYDPQAHQIIDYVDGCRDIESGILRTIGDPGTRYRQDPVRMIRLLKFRARFGFDVEKKAIRDLEIHREEIIKSSPARVMEEIFRMLESGSSEPFLRLLQEHGLLELIFPMLSTFLESSHGESMYQFLRAADELVLSGRKGFLDRSVLFSCLIFPLVEEEIIHRYVKKEKTPHLGLIIQLVAQVLEHLVDTSFPPLPRRTRVEMQDIMGLQYRITPLTSRRQKISLILQHSSFPQALELLRIRSMVNPDLEKEMSFWDEHPEVQNLSDSRKKRRPTRRRRSRRPKSSD